MNNTDYLEPCKYCKKRVIKKESGIVCDLTGEKPASDDKCPDFELDEKIVKVKEVTRERNDLIQSNDTDFFYRNYFPRYVLPIVAFVLISFVVGALLVERYTINRVKPIKQACYEIRRRIPLEVEDGVILTGVDVAGRNVLFDYSLQDSEVKGLSSKQKEFKEQMMREDLMHSLPMIVIREDIYPFIDRAGFGVRWQYSNPGGDIWYSISATHKQVHSALSEDYEYHTLPDSFRTILILFGEYIPYNLTEDVQLTGLTLKDDCTELSCYAKVVGKDLSFLESMSKSDLKDLFFKSFDLIRRTPLSIAVWERIPITINLTATTYEGWNTSVTFESDDYETIVTN